MFIANFTNKFTIGTFYDCHVEFTQYFLITEIIPNLATLWKHFLRYNNRQLYGKISGKY